MISPCGNCSAIRCRGVPVMPCCAIRTFRSFFRSAFATAFVRGMSIVTCSIGLPCSSKMLPWVLPFAIASTCGRTPAELSDVMNATASSGVVSTMPEPSVRPISPTSTSSPNPRPSISDSMNRASSIVASMFGASSSAGVLPSKLKRCDASIAKLVKPALICAAINSLTELSSSIVPFLTPM